MYICTYVYILWVGIYCPCIVQFGIIILFSIHIICTYVHMYCVYTVVLTLSGMYIIYIWAKIKFALMSGAMIFQCHPYIWSSTVLHNIYMYMYAYNN